MKTINITGLSKKSIPAHPTANLRSELVITEIRLGPPVTLAEKQHIYRLLAILLQSGLGIMDCIYLVVEQTGGKEARRVLARLGEDLAAGHSFSSCLSSQGTVFSAFEINSLRMGEQSGQLGEVFNSLANYFEKKVNLRRSVIQALSYPVTVIAISLVVMAFMLGFVVPMFRDIFQQFDAKLPAITEWVIGIAEFFTSGGWLVVPFAGILAGVGFLLRKRARFRRISSKIISRIPFLGEFVLKLSLARLAHSLGMLLSARVSLDQALDLSGQMAGYFPVEEAIKAIRVSVTSGSTFFEAIQKTKVFPIFFIQIIRVGEQSARLGEMTGQLARTMEEETERTIQQITRLVEPLLILVLGGMVALILIAMYLPMFELGNAIN